MTAHLGGPETEDKLLDRHRRYLQIDDPGAGLMFAVVLSDGQRAGHHRVLGTDLAAQAGLRDGLERQASLHGRGIATAAARAVAVRARSQHRHGELHAFPAADHPASNAVCRKAGFTLRGETDFEYPPGTIMRCNDWQLEL